MRLNGALIRQLRENAGMTLTELARTASISKAYLSYIENDRRDVGPPIAAQLAQALGVAVVDLRAPE